MWAWSSGGRKESIWQAKRWLYVGQGVSREENRLPGAAERTLSPELAASKSQGWTATGQYEVRSKGVGLALENTSNKVPRRLVQGCA